MTQRWRLMVFILAGAVAVGAGCRGGGKKAKPTTTTSGTTKPTPSGGETQPPIKLPEPPKVKPGDVAAKANVAFGFYLEEKGPLTPVVTWDKSKGRLTIRYTHSLVNIGPRGNTRVEAPAIQAADARSLLANCVERTYGKLPEVKSLEVHVLFKKKDVGRLTASREQMGAALKAANAVKSAPRYSPKWVNALLEKLPEVWISPTIS
jgi:hypothetical protein